MKVLAVETATSKQSIALLQDETVVARQDRDVGGKHGRFLVAGIDQLLRSIGWSLVDLDALIVSVGPGSFTGLRVGLATMMGFRLVTGVPIVAVPTLEAMAWNLRGADGILCPVLKARTGEVYWAVYQWTADCLSELTSPQVGSLAHFVKALPASATVYGEGWQVHRDALQALLLKRHSSVHEIEGERGAVSAVSVGLAGVEKLNRGETAGSALAPFYVQRAEAEAKFTRRAAATQEIST